jgi:hypothetical protein
VVTKRSSGVSRSKAPRAADAMNKPQEARAYYEQAARYSTAYYGQLARVKLGLSELALESSPVPEADKRAALANSEIVRAVEILYATNQRDLVVPIAADLAERGSDLAVLAALGEQMAQHEDAGCTLLIGRGALGRGHAFDDYTFPRAAALHGAGGRACGRVFDRAPGEWLQCKGSVERARARSMQVTPQAGQNNHQEVQRRL